MFESYFEVRDSLVTLLLIEHVGDGTHELETESWVSRDGRINRKWYFKGLPILGTSTGVNGTIFYTNDKKDQCEVQQHP
jgi:hypothetical protein